MLHPLTFGPYCIILKKSFLNKLAKKNKIAVSMSDNWDLNSLWAEDENKNLILNNENLQNSLFTINKFQEMIKCKFCSNFEPLHPYPDFSLVDYFEVIMDLSDFRNVNLSTIIEKVYIMDLNPSSIVNSLLSERTSINDINQLSWITALNCVDKAIDIAIEKKVTMCFYRQCLKKQIPMSPSNN